jgi:uncharacterized protein YgiM (DUF1202 family)
MNANTTRTLALGTVVGLLIGLSLQAPSAEAAAPEPAKATISFQLEDRGTPSVVFTLIGIGDTPSFVYFDQSNDIYPYVNSDKLDWIAPWSIDGKTVSKKKIDTLWADGLIYEPSWQKKHTIGHKVRIKDVPEGSYYFRANVANDVNIAKVTVAKTNSATAKKSTAIRAKAKNTAKKIATFGKGATITVTGTAGAWYEVNYKGKTGYVAKTATKNYKTGTSVTTTVLNAAAKAKKSAVVSAKAKKSASKVATLKKGTKVSIIGSTGDWYKIKYKGKTRYILKSQTDTLRYRWFKN